MPSRCPICAGVGRVLAFGACRDPIAVPCPECAGLAIVPASADDLRAYTAREITQMLLRRPALPPATGSDKPEPLRVRPVEFVDQDPQTTIGGPVEMEPDPLEVESIVVGDLNW